MVTRIHVIGFSDSGKTLLIERLIPALVTAGVRVGTVKHAHALRDLDTPGTDSHRHRAAGADVTVLAGASSWMVHRSGTPDIDEILRAFDPGQIDLVLVEGFTHSCTAAIVLAGGREPHLSVDDAPVLRLDEHPSTLDADGLGRVVHFCLSTLSAGR